MQKENKTLTFIGKPYKVQRGRLLTIPSRYYKDKQLQDGETYIVHLEKTTMKAQR